MHSEQELSATINVTYDDALMLAGVIQFAKDMSGGRANTSKLESFRARVSSALADPVDHVMTDTQRLEYLMAMLDLIVPDPEKQGQHLSRVDVDRVMKLWPSPAACIAAMIPSPAEA